MHLLKFRTVLNSLAVGLQYTPNSPYLNIFSGYTDSHGNKATKQFSFGGSYVYTYASTALSETVVIFSALGDSSYGSAYGSLFPPPNNYYDISSFYLGLKASLTTCIDSITHTQCTFGQTPTCTFCRFTAPNGDIPSDAAATAYMHEVFEAITDSPMGGLYGFHVRDSTAQCYLSEIGDLCTYSYSGITSFSNSSYNLQLSNGAGGYLYFMAPDMFDHLNKVCSNGIPYTSSAPIVSNNSETLLFQPIMIGFFFIMCLALVIFVTVFLYRFTTADKKSHTANNADGSIVEFMTLSEANVRSTTGRTSEFRESSFVYSLLI